MTFVVDSRSIRGLSSWTRFVTVAENNSGTLRTCVETWTFFICRADSWLELVVVSHDQIMSWSCFCGFGLNSDACAYMCMRTLLDAFRSGCHTCECHGPSLDLVTDAYRRFVESRLETYPFLLHGVTTLCIRKETTTVTYTHTNWEMWNSITNAQIQICGVTRVVSLQL